MTTASIRRNVKDLVKEIGMNHIENITTSNNTLQNTTMTFECLQTDFKMIVEFKKRGLIMLQRYTVGSREDSAKDCTKIQAPCYAQYVPLIQTLSKLNLISPIPTVNGNIVDFVDGSCSVLDNK